MSKNADQPAYPVIKTEDKNGVRNGVSPYTIGDTYSTGGLTKREKLAMEIYARSLFVNKQFSTEQWDGVIEKMAAASLRAADIFFEQLEKNK